ncbi:putative RNA pseudouridine synthase [Campylobacterota bacterium]|nr:putative RNA pseudouridine synthase [Campylobacterota bacterium]
MDSSSKTRINKAIAERGGYSRREADRLIVEGKVSIGREKVVDLATRVGDEDEIFVDGKRLEKRHGEMTAIVYHKPKGELVTRSDPQGRKTIFQSLPPRFSRFIAAGRLDYASEGLLILTDNADLATKLMTSKLERIYNIKVSGFITKAIERAMESGIEVAKNSGAHPLSEEKEMSLAPFSKWRIEKNHPNYSRMKAALIEGKNREIRRFFAHFDLDVLDLKRVSFGEVSLNALPIGKWRFCSREEYRYLHKIMKEEDDDSNKPL